MPGHRESMHLLLAEHLGHLVVRGEVMLVGWVLEVLLFQVRQQELDALGLGGHPLANDGCQVSRQLHGLGQTASFAGQGVQV